MEALTSCARRSAERLPFLPRPSRHAGVLTDTEAADEVEARRNYGRLQSLVFAAADAAEQVMEACEDAIDRAAAAVNDNDDDDDDGGSGGGSPAANGEPRGGPGSPGELTGGTDDTPPSQPTPDEPTPTPIPPRA